MTNQEFALGVLVRSFARNSEINFSPDAEINGSMGYVLTLARVSRWWKNKRRDGPAERLLVEFSNFSLASGPPFNEKTLVQLIRMVVTDGDGFIGPNLA